MNSSALERFISGVSLHDDTRPLRTKTLLRTLQHGKLRGSLDSSQSFRNLRSFRGRLKAAVLHSPSPLGAMESFCIFLDDGRQFVTLPLAPPNLLFSEIAHREGCLIQVISSKSLPGVHQSFPLVAADPNCSDSGIEFDHGIPQCTRELPPQFFCLRVERPPG